MVALTIGLGEASRLIGLSERELLEKCQSIGLPVYCRAPSSVGIWRFRSITDDPRFSVLGRIAAQVTGFAERENPRKRSTEEELPPTLVESQVFFRLSDKNIGALLCTGLEKSRGFDCAYSFARDGHLSQIEPGEPTAEEIALLSRRTAPYLRLGSEIPFQGGYCRELYGLVELNVRPQGIRDVREVELTLEDTFFERREFLENRQELEPTQIEDILRVFPELSSSISSDGATNQLPESLVQILGACIKAWKMTDPGSTLKTNIAWIKSTLTAKSDSSLSEEVIGKAFTLCAHGYDYTPGMQMHEWVPDPSRKPELLVVQENEQLEKQIRRSGLLILVDAWLKCFLDQDLWDDMNKKPDRKAIKAAADDAVAILEAYTSRTVARSMRPVLSATQPWQDN